MKNKLLIVGNADGGTEIKKLLSKLFVARIETAGTLPSDLSGSDFICACGGIAAADKLETLGYKTVLIAYMPEAVNEASGNGDLQRLGYSFEDGM